MTGRLSRLVRSILLGLAMACALALPAFAAEPIGFVKTLKGSAVVQRGGERVALAVGAPIFRLDLCETGRNASLGISLRDNTLISLGPKTRLTIEEFAFEPVEQKYGLMLRLARGTMQYISGLVAKLSPQSVQVTTPTANIAVRGTRFAIRVADGK